MKKAKKVNFEGDDEPKVQNTKKEALEIINNPSVSQFIADDGSVYMFSNVPKKSKKTLPDLEILVFGTKIDLKGKVYYFEDELSFPKSVVKDVQDLIDEQIKDQNNILEQFKREQEQLPKQFRNSQKADSILDKIDKLELSKNTIFHCQIFNDKAKDKTIDDLLLV